MAKKQMLFKTKGMNQDLSVSAFNPEFSFENMNLRLSTNEGNTLMSWVNERGTSEISIVTGKWNPEDKNNTTISEIIGTPIGTAVINHKLVVFTTENPTSKVDRIYLLKFNDSKSNLLGIELYEGDLNFQVTNPLETLVSYESENIQKIYWVDGINQPRVINIAKEDYTGKPNTFFDFIPTLKLKETVTVQKILGGNGTFAPGVIQYAFTYYNKYGQESNIFYTTPLYYLSHKDRGASPEDKVDNAFKITINTVDENFDYLRIYSIQRTSINGTPICKRIQDIEINNSLDWVDTYDHTKGHKASYTDTGTSGDSIDPTELLYKGGEAIIANTIEQKDGTLFLGNFRNDRKNLNNLKDNIESYTTVSSANTDTFKRIIKANLVSTGDYFYASQLTATNNDENTCIPCGGFKRGDYYRCGIQFQHKTGKWSEPIFINDVEVLGKPEVVLNGYNSPTNQIKLPVLKGIIDFSQSGRMDTITELISEGYRKVRPVVVFPEMKDRVTLCQGVAAPTVYTKNHRGDGDADNNTSDLYAQSSWFFRTPYGDNEQVADDGTVMPYYGANAMPYAFAGKDSSNKEYDPVTIRGIEVQGDFSDNNKFRVNNNFLTFHSPDVEFDTQLWNTSFISTIGKKVGTAQISKTWADISIQTESPTISEKGNGFTHRAFSKPNLYGIVSGLFYEDFIVDDAGDEDKDLVAWNQETSAYRWMVYPWNKDGSLNNDINRPADRGTPTAILKKKVISNLRIAKSSDWNDSNDSLDFSFSGNPELFSSEEVTLIKVNGKVYEGNIDTMLTPDVSDGMYFAHESTNEKAEVITPFTSKNYWWKTYSKDPANPNDQGLRRWDTSVTPPTWKYAQAAIGNGYVDLVMKKAGVRMKYKSTPHIVFQNGVDLFGSSSDSYYKLPIVEIRRNTSGTGNTFLDNIYGGKSTDALKENNWVPCGEPVPICNSQEEPISIINFEYSYGDTYFQRWDCLKTYAFTPEDINQVVEIGSFMLETRVNIDGRYDRNRGQVNNTNMSPRNFNLLNPVYSQIDNFFTYKILDDSYYENNKYLNQITWSKTKETGADVDLWTNITLASVLELDGDKGEINKLIRFNNYLFAFQDSGIAQILYNDNVQISATNGVPIEIANSGKVSGKDYKSNTIGCSNKWSMATTPNGIYFMDSNDKSIYLFNGQLQNVTSALGFNSWAKKEIPSMDVKWDPKNFDTFVSYFDKKNQDVMFINKNRALAYSEKLGAFTSFYDYGDTPFFCNLDDTGIWLKKDGSLWKHQGSNEYCKFFNVNKPYWMTLIGNPEPQLDKIFTNLEFRACVEGDGEQTNVGKFVFSLPFDSLETWNEYQQGITALSQKNGHSMFKHGGNDSALIRKFRIWRCDIPRDNYSGENTFDATFDNTFRNLRQTHPTDRMRNPWLYLKLMKKADTDKKTEIHDIVMTYFD